MIFYIISLIFCMKKWGKMKVLIIIDWTKWVKLFFLIYSKIIYYIISFILFLISGLTVAGLEFIMWNIMSSNLQKSDYNCFMSSRIKSVCQLDLHILLLTFINYKKHVCVWKTEENLKESVLDFTKCFPETEPSYKLVIHLFLVIELTETN